MKKMLIGFCIGVAVSSTITIVLYLRQDQAVRNAWDAGFIQGKHDVAASIERNFGRYDGKAPFKEVFSVKATSVLRVESNGVDTIRVTP